MAIPIKGYGLKSNCISIFHARRSVREEFRTAWKLCGWTQARASFYKTPVSAKNPYTRKNPKRILNTPKDR
jgi:hypothetical protein